MVKRKWLAAGSTLVGFLGLSLVFAPGRLAGQADESSEDPKSAEICPLKELMRDVDARNRKLKASVNKVSKSSAKSSAKGGVTHDAYLIALLADDASRYPLPEDSEGKPAEWKKMALSLRDHARSLAGAAKAGKSDEAKDAYNSMQRSCADCHEKFKKEQAGGSGGF